MDEEYPPKWNQTHCKHVPFPFYKKCKEVTRWEYPFGEWYTFFSIVMSKSWDYGALTLPPPSFSLLDVSKFILDISHSKTPDSACLKKRSHLKDLAREDGRVFSRNIESMFKPFNFHLTLDTNSKDEIRWSQWDLNSSLLDVEFFLATKLFYSLTREEFVCESWWMQCSNKGTIYYVQTTISFFFFLSKIFLFLRISVYKQVCSYLSIKKY